MSNFYEMRDSIEAWYEGRDKGKGTGYKQFKRWEYMMEPRLYPSGEIANTDLRTWNTYHRYKAEQLASGGRDNITHNGSWNFMGGTDHTSSTGYNGGVGRVTCIAFHPTDPNIIFVGTPQGGLWKTTTGGNSWTCLTDGLPILGVSAIAVDYTCLLYTSPSPRD